MPEETNENAQVAQESAPITDAERTEIFNQTAIEEAELARQKESELLPDDDEPTAKIKSEFQKKEKEYQNKLKKLEEERETYDKRLRDTQHKLHMVTADKSKSPSPDSDTKENKPSFNDYVNGIVNKFEESPTDAVKQMIQDFASDRETMRRQYTEELSSLRESVVQEIMLSSPDNAKYMAKVEELNSARPDLADLNFKQKLEFVKLMDAANKGSKTSPDNNEYDKPFDRNLISGGKRNAVKSNGLPDWVNAPEIQKEAAKRFGSKREIIDWSDPVKAMAMAKKIAARRRVEE